MSGRVRVAVITVSDGCAAGTRADSGGDLVAERLAALPAEIVSRAVVPDSVPEIQHALTSAISAADCVVLTGGTGLGPRDVTPQAVAPLLGYDVPGMAEAMRSEGLRHTPHAMLSRQLVGVAQGCLVIALPGSPRAVGECIDTIWAALPHALALLRGETAHRPADAGHD
ncbi:MAG: MogA/MoaB family molybdenum cofactor biosynthesis protein [Candidatus Dormibacteraeota bacterium]|nr:MogA/MoaB family molybdenum cofactor biosynthesis protein [Candidatus Dormibacteraeota bacterium]